MSKRFEDTNSNLLVITPSEESLEMFHSRLVFPKESFRKSGGSSSPTSKLFIMFRFEPKQSSALKGVVVLANIKYRYDFLNLLTTHRLRFVPSKWYVFLLRLAGSSPILRIVFLSRSIPCCGENSHGEMWVYLTWSLLLYLFFGSIS